MPVESEDNRSSITTTPTSQQGVAYKLGRYLWGKDPINSLSHTYFISSQVHKILRHIFMVFHILVLIWTAITIEKVYYMAAYMTLWGFTICTVYFSLVNLVKHSHHSKKRWKFVYALGEIGATLEFLICPFFFIFLFPPMLKGQMTWDAILLQVCLHFLCPLFIWIETI